MWMMLFSHRFCFYGSIYQDLLLQYSTSFLNLIIYLIESKLQNFLTIFSFTEILYIPENVRQTKLAKVIRIIFEVIFFVTVFPRISFI